MSCLYLLLSRAQSSRLIGLYRASQFHAQDVLGQYSYGYSGGPSAKIESKTADGITRGGYSYIDANGILQTVNYIADPINGFRVAATNLPQAPLQESVQSAEQIPAVKLTQGDIKFSAPEAATIFKIGIENPLQALNLTPEELKLTALPMTKDTIGEQKLASVKVNLPVIKASVISTAPSLKFTPLSAPAYNLSPVTFAYHPTPYLNWSPFSPLVASYPIPKLPVPEKTSEASENTPKIEERISETTNNERSKRDIIYSPIYTTSNQYEVKDNLGNYVYGYQNPQSAKAEVRSAGGSTNGAYSYVDANGSLQSVQYTADANGFRVAATNLPIA